MASRNAQARTNFSKIPTVVEYPDLLDVQMKSFGDFLQLHVLPGERKRHGLQNVFLNNFPITDPRENFILEFIEYHLDKPKYSIEECQERGLTYALPLKATLRLASKEQDRASEDFMESVEQEVYLGNLPMMTERGTFIINGAERVIVSQLHRSPGVFFGESLHPNGMPIYSARIIPFRGSWVEFTTDIQNVMYAYIDRKKKFPVTMLLRALGFSSNEEILGLFDLTEEVSVSSPKFDECVARQLANDVIDTKTGEVFMALGAVLTPEDIERLKKSPVKKIKFFREEYTRQGSIIANTIEKDPSRSEEDALEGIYRQMRSSEAPDLETARSLISKIFFDPKRYDLGDVGRIRLNAKLKLTTDPAIRTLTREDIVAIIRYLIALQEGRAAVDDIDHLGNRRVRSVGEQLAAQYNVGVARMARTIRERLAVHNDDPWTPTMLINARTISSVINSFFGTNQLSQFMDQTNPLAEMTHKRRLSALGPGGLTRERAGFEVRDVHYTHYGRLCPIETPEGPNIGLISSLCVHARLNELGFVETPYRRVKNGRATNQIDFLTAEVEDLHVIAQANTPLDERGHMIVDKVSARQRGEYVVVEPDVIDYMDVAPSQIVSAAAALIPFLEHDDANRALMGSNMQRQAVPLLRPEAPIVGTGLESRVARDSRTLIMCERDGIVEYVDAEKIVMKYDDDGSPSDIYASFDERRIVEYKLLKFFRTNQDTCVNQKPVVKEGQRMRKGDVLADGAATDHGDLALGRNLIVAFMPWRGYNFEDAIVISERVVSEDVYTSVHIEEFEVQVRDTKRGEEELTREIPNVSEEATANLDENGIIRIGAFVSEGDILIGKVTPKGETDPTPEEKLLRAIFGDKAGDVKDASLKAPPGMKGVVIYTSLFSRKGVKKEADEKKEIKKAAERVDKKFKADVTALNEKLSAKLDHLLEGETARAIRTKSGATEIRSGTAFHKDSFAQRVDVVGDLNPLEDWTEDKRKANLVRKIYENYNLKLTELEDSVRSERGRIGVGDELQPGIQQVARVFVAKKRKLSVGDKMAGRHGNKGIVAKIVPQQDMPFLPDGRPVDIVLNPLGVPSRMNLGQLYEAALGWAGWKLGKKFATPIFDGARWSDVQEWLKKAGLDENSRTTLSDGRTGEPFDQKVTVGCIYMMKLSHMVDDKIHARSTGPYSLITQQPLGGKAQFGGQRFGEMEVWALEAYGASHVLQEILTIKSDDVHGRAKTYEAIVKGENIPDSNVPESFNVLKRELQGLGLDVRLES